MHLASYVADFIATLGVTEVFGITGGGAMYLNDAIGSHPAYRFIAPHHEQSCAMAAEAYTRVSGRIGVVHVTTGPGGTNALTGVCGAWIDSIPMLVISGQVMVKDMIGGSGLRQMGVQEADTIAMARPVTKYAVTVTEPKMIRYHLEKAVHYATTGRPGPVWIDIPLDVQNAVVDPATLPGYEPEPPRLQRPASYLDQQIEKCVALLAEAQRPVIISGYGVRLAGAEREFRALVEKLGIPVVTSWNTSDLLPSDHPCNIGRGGIFGERAGNFAVQNADLLLIVGSRMSIPQTGYNYATFARAAKQIVVDIDENELIKPSLRPDVPVVADAKAFVDALSGRLGNHEPQEAIAAWRDTCQDWRRRYPVVLDEYRELDDKVNSFHFVEQLSRRLPSGAVVVTDMGTSFTCTMQTFATKENQRLFTSSGLAAMGFGLPGAIGACFANDGRRTICVTGDGGLMFNIQELQTIAHYELPVTIFVLSNGGYLTIKLMQQNHFKRMVASDRPSGVSCPDFVKVAQAFGIEAMRIGRAADLEEGLDRALSAGGPILCDIAMPELQPLIPRVQTNRAADGRLLPMAIEDMYPFLDREEFRGNMIVPPVSAD